MSHITHMANWNTIRITDFLLQKIKPFVGNNREFHSLSQFVDIAVREKLEKLEKSVQKEIKN